MINTPYHATRKAASPVRHQSPKWQAQEHMFKRVSLLLSKTFMKQKKTE